MPQKYLKLYDEHSDYTLDSREYIPNVSHCREEDEVHYRNDLSREYLTFKILSDGEIGWNQHSTLNREVQYSLNGGIWTTLPTSGISVTKGDKVRFKATCTGYSNTSVAQNHFTATAKLDIYGNIASLIQGDEFTTTITISSWAFAYLFKDIPVVSAKNLTLCGSSYGCFFHLFHGCTQLIDAPSLIDIKLGSEIFGGMFYGCTSLVIAPQIPMVNNNNFKTFGLMFYGCTSLKKAPKLPSTITSHTQYAYMFYNCTSLEEAPELPATTLGQDCYSYMFYGCTNLKTAPVLAAPTLVQGCYQSMFQGCSSLNHITCLATDISATDCTKNWVSGVAATGTFVKATEMEDWTIGVNGIPQDWIQKNDLNDEPLTFTITSDGTVTLKANDASHTITFEYRKNNSEWTSITSTTSGETINVVTGDTLQFKSPENVTYTTIGNGNGIYNYFGGTATFNASGNIMSLLDGVNFKNMTSLSGTYTFSYLFSNSKIVDAGRLILPATTLAQYCYFYMFDHCRNLTRTPVLPAKKLTNYCYVAMFEDCHSLTTIPKLPATQLATACYRFMFESCSGLINLSNCTLPATTLATYCYDRMFQLCNNLTTTPVICGTSIKASCYAEMFSHCGKLTTISFTLPATTLANYCYFKMFDSCTSLTTAPELPATTLSNYCYNYMFDGCTSLNYVKCLATTNISNSCTGWLRNVSSSGTFVKNASATWPEGINGIPTNWTVETA